MGRLKSKWNLLAVVLAVSALLTVFYIAYASVVQWSRAQSITFASVSVDVLDPTAMTLYQNEALTDELTAEESLEFKMLQYQPPLDKILGQGAKVQLWVRNDSETPLNLVEGNWKIFDPNNAESELGTYFVNFEQGQSGNPIQPGEARKLWVSVGGNGLLGRDDISILNFSI